MNNHRKTAIIVGILFIIATLFLFVGEAIYQPILLSPDYLEIAYPNRMIAIPGILLEFACVLAIPLIPVFLFPILRKHNEALALGYFGFRFLEAVLFVLVQINKLSLISVSQGFINDVGANAPYFQNVGGTIQSWNFWNFSFYILFFTVGALMLYATLYQSKLVPRWISAWGLIAAVLLLTGIVMEMLEMFSAFPVGGRELVYAAPIAVNEMVLAVWLIVKGFNSSALEPEAGDSIASAQSSSSLKPV
ncbi:MAG: DUF4386 domain-containing protein [Candidatus Promineifilaceae bacterium]|nr:DUF4386 domain-containing protein [Candidatus Promineifilaceae bacterium]